MALKNPFSLSYSELIKSNRDFLSLFDVSYLTEKNDSNEQLISENMFDKTVFLSSSSGGGKSSLLHLFSPSVLFDVSHTKKMYEDTYRYLESLGAIQDGEPRLLGIYISCARNYEIIDDIYSPEKRVQVFFALLNVRILKEVLKSILVLHEADENSLGNISFKEIPSELSSIFDAKWNGKDYYDWACNEELQICNALNDMSEIQPISFIHYYLSITQLINPDNILYDGEVFVDKALLMFDDVHILTVNQRKRLRESLLTVRSRVGVWLTQRTYGLEDSEVLGLDGTNERDYMVRRFEDYVKYKNFTMKGGNALINIANRRVSAAELASEGITSFSSCISEELPRDNVFKEKIEKVYNDLVKKYSNYIDSETVKKALAEDSSYVKAVTMRTIGILIERKLNSKQLFLSDEFIRLDSMDVINAINNKALRDSASYYLAIEYGLPFYYGSEKLCSMAFGNAYQFLSFFGAVFERRLTYKYNKRKNTLLVVSSRDQDGIVREISKRKWKDLRTLFVNSEEIMGFIKNIAQICVITRVKGTASYNGGTFTGIGIRESIFCNLIRENEKFKRILLQCISNNLLRRQLISQGTKGEQSVVFYLNRWICINFELPLAYGGWKPVDKKLLKHICDDPCEEFEKYYQNNEREIE